MLLPVEAVNKGGCLDAFIPFLAGKHFVDNSHSHISYPDPPSISYHVHFIQRAEESAAVQVHLITEDGQHWKGLFLQLTAPRRAVSSLFRDVGNQLFSVRCADMCDVMKVPKDKSESLDGELMGLIEDQVREFDALQVPWEECDRHRHHHELASHRHGHGVSRTRRRPRLELLELRDAAHKLQQQLDGLRHNWQVQVMKKWKATAEATPSASSKPHGHPLPDAARSVLLKAEEAEEARGFWKQIAEQELLARHQSEQENLRLKRLLQQQIEISREVMGCSNPIGGGNGAISIAECATSSAQPPSCQLRLEAPVASHTDGEPQISMGGDFAELTGSAESSLDASTLLDLVWKCFVSMAQHSDESGDRDDRHTATTNSQMPFVADGILHIKAQFTTRLAQTQQLQVDGHSAMKKLSNGVLWELTGTMQLSASSTTTCDPQPKAASNTQHHSHEDPSMAAVFPITFVRSVWCCIEPLANGKCLVHHGVRIKPTSSSHFLMDHDVGTGSHGYSRQLELLVQWMHQCRADAAERFLKVLEHDLS